MADPAFATVWAIFLDCLPCVTAIAVAWITTH
jgi:hypothetical protein